MLNTLIALGKEIAQQQGEWDNLVEIPKKIYFTNKNGDPIENYVLIVTFDIDNHSVVFNDGLRAFGNESPTKYRNIKTEKWGRSGDPWAISCSYPDKIKILQKSIFGKPNESSTYGLFQKAIIKKLPDIKNTLFYKALENCYSLRNIELEDGKRGIDSLTSDYISKMMKGQLSKNQKIVLISLAIKSESLGIEKPKLLCELDGFDKFIKQQCLKNKIKSDDKEKLCYVSGKNVSDVCLPEFSDREDLNKMFVTTTLNYAINFNKKGLIKNYQIGVDSQSALETGSNFIRGKLNNHPCSVNIANMKHFIIPSFLNYEGLDLKFEMEQIQKLSEWIFATEKMTNLFQGIEDEANGNLFWINYVAYYSKDGNSVKVINHIKDVSSIWFFTIVKKSIEQTSLISKYFNQKWLNLSTIYYSIPIRKEHEQKNDALKLLSQILEQREVSKQKLFHHFTELILCHYYDRSKSYSNITVKPENFVNAINDSVIKYLFLLNFLKSLNLTDMEKNEKAANDGNENPDKLVQFFRDMGYSQQQESLYWLGRIVNKIGTAQYNKGHLQKPVLNKINYNGMDYSKIQRLFIDSFELSTQYQVSNDIKFASNMFQQYFPGDINLWKITPQEAVFFILSGFSLYINNNKKQ